MAKNNEQPARPALLVRLNNADELQRLKDAAALDERPTTIWARRVLLAAAAAELRKRGKL